MKIGKFYKYSIGTILILTILFLFSYMPFLVLMLRIIVKLIFYPFIFAGFFYYMLRPIIRFLDRKNISRNISVLIVFLSILIVLVAAGIYGGVSIKEEFSSFSKELLGKSEKLLKNTQEIFKNNLHQFVDIEKLKEKSLGFLESGLRGAKGSTVTIINRISEFISMILLIPVVLFFLLKDDKKFVHNFFKSFPLKNKEKTKIVLRHIDQTLSTYILSRLIVSFVIGILTFIGYLIIKLPSAFILSVLTGALSIIPMVGPIISILPALIIALGGGISLIVKVVIITFIVQQVEGNLITPKVIGENLKIHPLTIIFLVIISITLLGFIGGLISVPVYAVLKVIIKDINEFKTMNELK